MTPVNVDRASENMRKAAERRLQEQNEARYLAGIRLEKPSDRRKRLASSGGNSPPPTPKTATLQQTTLFRGISRLLGQKLTAGLEERVVRAGCPIYSEGDVQNWLGILESGHASVLANLGGIVGKPQKAKVGEVTARSAFGELCAFGLFEQRTSTLLALEDCVVLVLPGHRLWEALEKHPEDDEQFVARARQWRAVFAAPMLEHCHPEIVYQLHMKMEISILEEGHVLSKKGELGETTIFLMSGEVASQSGAFLEAGSVIDEGACLGTMMTRGDTLVCNSECHIAALHRDVLWSYIQKFGQESAEFQRLALSIIFDGNSPDEETTGPCAFFNNSLGCPDEFVRELRQKRKQIFAPPGTVLQEEGTTSDMLNIVLHGRATVSICGYQFSEITSGNFFGELSILNITPRRRVSIKAKSFCVIDSFKRSDIEKAAHRYQNVRLKFREMAKLQAYFVPAPGIPHNAQLVELSFFQGVSGDLLSDVSAHLEDRLYFPGNSIIVKGERGDFMVILHEGSALVTARTFVGKVVDDGGKNIRPSSTGSVHLLDCDLKPISISGGSIFGEKALLGVTSERSATVTATSICCVQVLHRTVLTRALRRHPSEKKHFDMLALSEMESEIALSKFSIYMLPLFKDCPSRFIYLLDLYLERKLCCKDETIVEEGTEGEEMFILYSGIANVEVGGTQVCETTEGACFGEMAVLGISNKRTATVRAAGLCDVRILHRRNVEEALREFPEERKRFEALAALRMRSQIEVAKGGIGKTIPFFKQCDPAFVEEIGDEMEDRIYMAGQALVTENEMGDCLFVLHKGSAEVLVGGKRVAEIHDGGVVGEMAALGISRKRTATIVATETCFVQLLYRQQLNKAMKKYPQERQQFERIAAKRIEEFVYNDSVRCLDFFRGCPRKYVELLDSHLERRLFFVDDTILHADSPGQHLIILFSGSATVEINGQVASELKEGDFCGETTVLGIKPVRTATVRARDLCDTQVIHRRHLNEALDQFPSEYTRFINVAATRLRQNLEREKGVCLQKVAVFSLCSPGFLESITPCLEDRLYLPGEMICQEGLVSDHMICICEGTADIEIGGAKVGELHPGGMVGEINVIGMHPVSVATVRATAVCLVQFLQPADCLRFLKDFPSEFHDFQQSVVQNLEAIPMPCLLGDQNLFSGCCLELLELLEHSVERRFFFAQDTVSDENTPGEEFMMMRMGRALLECKQAPAGFLEAGACFGEMAVLGAKEDRPMTAIAETLCDVQILSRWNLQKALEKFPDERSRFDRIAAQRMVASLELNIEIALRPLHIFDGIGERPVRALAQRLEVLFAPSGCCIQRSTSANKVDAMYILLHGKASLEVNGMPVRTMQQGGITHYNTAAVLNVPTKRVTAIRALDGPLLMLQLTEDELAGALAGSPEVHAKLEKVTDALKHGSSVEETLKEYEPIRSLKREDKFIADLVARTEESVFLPGETILSAEEQSQYVLFVLSGTARAAAPEEMTRRQSKDPEKGPAHSREESNQSPGPSVSTTRKRASTSDDMVPKRKESKSAAPAQGGYKHKETLRNGDLNRVALNVENAGSEAAGAPEAPAEPAGRAIEAVTACRVALLHSDVFLAYIKSNPNAEEMMRSLEQSTRVLAAQALIETSFTGAQAMLGRHWVVRNRVTGTDPGALLEAVQVAKSFVQQIAQASIYAHEQNKPNKSRFPGIKAVTWIKTKAMQWRSRRNTESQKHKADKASQEVDASAEAENGRGTNKGTDGDNAPSKKAPSPPPTRGKLEHEQEVRRDVIRLIKTTVKTKEQAQADVQKARKEAAAIKTRIEKRQKEMESAHENCSNRSPRPAHGIRPPNTAAEHALLVEENAALEKKVTWLQGAIYESRRERQLLVQRLMMFQQQHQEQYTQSMAMEDPMMPHYEIH
eukprot:gnl/MRDRNA2_/MRDRNA2_30220_c0_seq1.p1 gnl/MRDRNA2_/MRDRNA2_30220_c0~~gnl/MRDRNA2_/MRDRNA2_30220_c0_seq1.p1  ORF type:complete len:2088 (-),score=405.19 gnl/MRDRNA2_/MRDRNA2_30220_c0_seq1:264-5960(-)